MERAVVEEYQRLIAEVLEPSSELPYGALVDIAESVMAVRGYAPIKEAAVAAWRERVARLRRPEPTG
jgi:indolepyruvate ferredoxin oxidoreductase